MLNFLNLDDAYRFLLSAALEQSPSVCPRGLPTRELTNLFIHIEQPRRRFVTIPTRRWKLRLALGELAWHLSGSQSVEPLTAYTRVWSKYSVGQKVLGSCYGHLIFGDANAKSQWDLCKELLRSDPHSRRAVIQLYDPTVNYIGSPDVSCTLSIQFLIRAGALDCTVLMRSNDVYFGFPYDVFFYTTLQELMAAELELRLGKYGHFATSMHLYERDTPKAEAVLKDRNSYDFSDFELRLPGERKLFCEAEAVIRSAVTGIEFVFQDEFWKQKYCFLKDSRSENNLSRYAAIFAG